LCTVSDSSGFCESVRIFCTHFINVLDKKSLLQIGPTQTTELIAIEEPGACNPFVTSTENFDSIALYETLNREHEVLKEKQELSLRMITLLEHDNDSIKRALEQKSRHLQEAQHLSAAQAAEILRLKQHIALFCTAPYDRAQ
jgi:hypothetical protein